MKSRSITAAIVCLASLAASGAARAWSAGGHMVIAAIAYDDLEARDPATLKRALVILEHHPDRGAFQVAAGDLSGEAHDRAMFEECARWPDDARGTANDHPTWHYAFHPLVRAGAAAPVDPISGDAEQALALSAHVLANPVAPVADRAVALCWVLHVLADMHQPLHAAQLFSPRFPHGDHGGAAVQVIDPVGGETISLHWLWDQAIERSVDPGSIDRRVRTLMARPPLVTRGPTTDVAGIVRKIADESYQLASSAAYAPSFQITQNAVSPQEDYLKAMTQIARVRAVEAGVRSADLLRGLLPTP